MDSLPNDAWIVQSACDIHAWATAQGYGGGGRTESRLFAHSRTVLLDLIRVIYPDVVPADVYEMWAAATGQTIGQCVLAYRDRSAADQKRIRDKFAALDPNDLLGQEVRCARAGTVRAGTIVEVTRTRVRIRLDDQEETGKPVIAWYWQGDRTPFPRPSGALRRGQWYTIADM
jgi:hypothetical protein